MTHLELQFRVTYFFFFLQNTKKSIKYHENTEKSSEKSSEKYATNPNRQKYEYEYKIIPKELITKNIFGIF